MRLLRGVALFLSLFFLLFNCSEGGQCLYGLGGWGDVFWAAGSVVGVLFFDQVVGFTMGTHGGSGNVALKRFAEDCTSREHGRKRGVCRKEYNDMLNVLGRLRAFNKDSVPLGGISMRAIGRFVSCLHSTRSLRGGVGAPEGLSSDAVRLGIGVLGSMLERTIEQKLLSRGPFSLLPRSCHIGTRCEREATLARRRLVGLDRAPYGAPRLGRTFLLDYVAKLEGDSVLDLSVGSVRGYSSACCVCGGVGGARH